MTTLERLTTFRDDALTLAANAAKAEYDDIDGFAVVTLGDKWRDRFCYMLKCDDCPLIDYWMSFEKAVSLNLENFVTYCFGCDTPFRKLCSSYLTPEMVRDCCLSIAAAADQQIEIVKAVELTCISD